VYLGFAPGVGKTYEMLQEGHRLKKQGVDVVIGVVETHGRADTAQRLGAPSMSAKARNGGEKIIDCGSAIWG